MRSIHDERHDEGETDDGATVARAAAAMCYEHGLDTDDAERVAATRGMDATYGRLAVLHHGGVIGAGVMVALAAMHEAEIGTRSGGNEGSGAGRLSP